MSTPVTDSPVASATSLPAIIDSDVYRIVFRALVILRWAWAGPTFRMRCGVTKLCWMWSPIVARWSSRVSVLDLGCGCGHLYEHLQQQSISQIEYTRDRSVGTIYSAVAWKNIRRLTFVTWIFCRRRSFWKQFDYIIINGVFTSRCSMSFEQMWSFVQAMLTLAFSRARQGLAL